MANNKATAKVAQPEATVQTTLSIPLAVWKAVRHQTIERRISAQAVWIEAMKDYLKRRGVNVSDVAA